MTRSSTWIGVFLTATVALQAASPYRIAARYPVAGDGGFDYLTVDTAGRRIYVSHATQVNVIDADTGKPIGTIPDTPGVHGIAIAPEFSRGFTSNGRENTVSIFDLATLHLIGKIDVGKGPDGIYFDAATKRVFTNNHGSHDISAIDAVTGRVIGSVALKGDGEQAVIGSDGLVYVNVEDTNEVVVFDPRSLEVKKRFPIEAARTPTGLAYDSKTNRLFIGTRNDPKMVVMNAADGHVITSVPIGANVDYAAFDPQSKQIFMSCGDGTLSIYRETSADTVEDAGAVKTQFGAKTLAFDAKTGTIFLPAVDYLETPASDPSKRPIRTVKPGSFVVLAVTNDGGRTAPTR